MSQEDLYKKTSDLNTELNASNDLQRFLKENEVQFIEPDIGSLIQDLMKEKQIGKAELARRSGMSTVYLYQLLSGRRTPSRDRMICISIGLGCTLEESQSLLKNSRFASLYLKVRRDAIICYGLDKHLDINQINDLLYENKEETLI